MHSKDIFILIILIFIIGCATNNKKNQEFYDSDYNVLDRGALNVKVTTQACSDKFKNAFSAAKKNGEFHLRSIVGSKNHRIKFKEVNSYVLKGKICVEMSASSFPH
tara:strand:- start:30 stop:347 length:318 start_codon:yes stop_codon:yes gene_type:complete